MDDVTPEMKKLLDFIDGKEPEDDFTRGLDKVVQSVRRNEKWMLDYMTLQMNYHEKYEEGIEYEKLETARRLIELGKLSLEDIAAGTGLLLEKVKEIADMQPV